MIHWQNIQYSLKLCINLSQRTNHIAMSKILQLVSGKTSTSFESINKTILGSDVLLIGRASGATAELTRRLKESVARLRVLHRLPASAGLDALPKASWMIIDIDALDGIESAIDDLLWLRRSRPDLVVVLLSAKFSRDSFDQTRLAIADACVRFPTTISTLRAAFIEAQHNNKSWSARQLDLAV